MLKFDPRLGRVMVGLWIVGIGLAAATSPWYNTALLVLAPLVGYGLGRRKR